MSKSNPSLIGSVFERKPTTSFTGPLASSSGKTGFPTVQHRSKSAFSRNREELRKPGYGRSQDAPPVLQSDTKPKPVDPDQWREQMSRENEQRVEGMTDEEREEERREIIERFGAGVGDLLRHVRNSRMKQVEATSSSDSRSQETPQDSSGFLQEGLHKMILSVYSILFFIVPIASIEDFSMNMRASSKKRRKSSGFSWFNLCMAKSCALEFTLPSLRGRV